MNRLISMAHLLLAAMLVLSVITFFLATNGKINNFPTYLAAIAMLILLPAAATRQMLATLPRSAWLFVALVAYLSLSTSWSQPVQGKLFGYGALIAVFVIGMSLTNHRFVRFHDWLTGLLVLSAALSAVMSIYLYMSLPDYQPLDEKRLYALGRLRNPVVGALCYGIAATIACHLACVNLGARRLGWLCLFAVLMVAIVLTETRSAWLGLFVSLPCIVLIQPSFSGRTRSIILGSGLLVISLLALVTWHLGYWAEVLHRSTSYRPELWLLAITNTLDHNLLLGHGMASSSKMTIDGLSFHHAHSLYVTTFYHGGLIGLGLLVTLIAWLALSLLRQPVTAPKILALACLGYSAAALSVDGDRILEKIDYLWIVFWLPVALALAALSEPALRDDAPKDVEG